MQLLLGRIRIANVRLEWPDLARELLEQREPERKLKRPWSFAEQQTKIVSVIALVRALAPVLVAQGTTDVQDGISRQFPLLSDVHVPRITLHRNLKTASLISGTSRCRCFTKPKGNGMLVTSRSVEPFLAR